MTQEALAEASELAADTIRRLEHGSFSPSLDTLRKASRGLGIRLSTLFLAFELVERDVLRETIDAVRMMSPDEQNLLLRLVHTFLGLLRDSNNSTPRG